MIEAIETPRLILREITAADAAGLFELDRSAAVHRYLGKNPLTRFEEVYPIIEFIQKQYLDFGTGRLAVIEKSTQLFIGWAGIKWVTDLIDSKNQFFDLGYRLQEQAWGRGIATEAAKACLQFGWEQLKAREIFAIADAENKGSINVLQKCGLTRLHHFDLEGNEHYWFRIEQPAAV